MKNAIQVLTAVQSDEQKKQLVKPQSDIFNNILKTAEEKEPEALAPCHAVAIK